MQAKLIKITISEINGQEAQLGEFEVFSSSVKFPLTARADLSSTSVSVYGAGIPLSVDGNVNNHGATTSTLPAHYVFELATQSNIDSYSLTPWYASQSIKNWVVSVSTDNGVIWAQFDAQSNITDWLDVTAKTFTPVVVTPTPTPTLTAAEILAADKARMTQIKANLMNRIAMNDEDNVFLLLGTSAKTMAVMDVLDNGGGFDEIKSLALDITETTILRILAIYFVKIDVPKYESEKAFDLITNFSVLNEFVTYLTTQNITPPSLKAIKDSIRANAPVYTALRTWAASRSV